MTSLNNAEEIFWSESTSLNEPKQREIDYYSITNSPVCFCGQSAIPLKIQVRLYVRCDDDIREQSFTFAEPINVVASR